jgi:hypothetical protein
MKKDRFTFAFLGPEDLVDDVGGRPRSALFDLHLERRFCVIRSLFYLEKETHVRCPLLLGEEPGGEVPGGDGGRRGISRERRGKREHAEKGCGGCERLEFHRED